jgi:hypothetical protein
LALFRVNTEVIDSFVEPLACFLALRRALDGAVLS